jgi:hypothetical protein
MASANYITSGDLTDSILTGISTAAYVVRANDAIENLAREFGVSVANIVTPIDHNIKLWGVYWLMKELLRDKAYMNDLEGAGDKYTAKYQMYYDECNRMQRKLNKEMFIGTATDAITASATSGVMLRG